MSTFRIKLSLFLNYFVFAILLNSVGTVILQVQNNFDVSKSSASVLEAFKDMSIAFTSFLIASYVNKIGYKRTMLIALALVAVMCLSIPSLPTFYMTKMLFAAAGIGFALIKVSVFATIGLVTKSKSEHLSFMNFLESFFMVGVLSGYFLFASMVDNSDPKSVTWFNTYYILGGLAAAAFVLLLTTKLDESSIKEAEKNKSATNDFTEMLQLVVLPLVLVFIFSAFFYVLIEQSIMSWLPTFNKDVLNISTSLSIQLASILSAFIGLGRLLAGIILRKVDWIYVLLGCLLCAGVVVLITMPMAANIAPGVKETLADVPVVAFAFPLIGLFLAPIYPAINSVILSNLPSHRHGAMSGLIVVFSALGGSTGSIITGNLSQAYGGETAFYLSLIPIAILIVLLIVFKRLQPKGGALVDIKTAGGH
ncbi:MFS transporter [Lacibacter luteus]|uniref:MFS transporter n=1 Tax=Lacibacter luteus TaxID=2508719 RepID=A0A4Q1CJN7_9BACT|nr:MFS transporter [Lacibacter luteus]RXK60881.1 MFS transporter [Lacibacter luteus]